MIKYSYIKQKFIVLLIVMQSFICSHKYQYSSSLNKVWQYLCTLLFIKVLWNKMYVKIIKKLSNLIYSQKKSPWNIKIIKHILNLNIWYTLFIKPCYTIQMYLCSNKRIRSLNQREFFSNFYAACSSKKKKT